MKRLWEIDSIRGIAVIGMIFFHLFFYLNMYEISTLDFTKGFWWIFPRIIASSFLFLVGVSLCLGSYQQVTGLQQGKIFIKKFLLRSLVLLGFGLLITIVTRIAVNDGFVIFGILHLIAFSILISYPLLRFKYLNLLLAVIVLVSGLLLGELRFPFYWFVWLGLRPADYYPVDYLPLLPWYSFVLFGMFAGRLFYSQGKRNYKIIDLSSNVFIRILCFTGRNSLAIYLIHHPVLFGLCQLIVLIRG